MKDGHLYMEDMSAGDTLPTNHCQVQREMLWKTPEDHMFLESKR